MSNISTKINLAALKHSSHKMKGQNNKMKKNTEVVVLQPEFETVLSTNKEIELTKAQAHAQAFAPSMQKYHEIAAKLSELDKENPTHEMAKIARRARLDLVPIRTEAGSIKDQRKAILLTESNLIQSLYNVVKQTCELTESEFLAIEKHHEKIEAAQKEKLRQDREQMLLPYEVDTHFIALAEMSDEQFNALFSSSKLAFETKKEQERIAEEQRIANEKKAEEERLERERLEKIEQEKRNKELAELQAKKALREARAAELQPYIVFIRDYNSLIELPEKEYKQQIAGIKKGAELEWEAQRKAQADQAKLKAENDRLRKQQEEEKARIEADEAEKLAKEKALLLAPDKEKVKAFFEKFKSLEFPELESEQGIKMSARVKEALQMVKSLIIEDSKTLL